MASDPVVAELEGEVHEHVFSEDQQRQAHARYEEFCAEHLNFEVITSQRELSLALNDLRRLKPREVGIDYETASRQGLFGPLYGTIRLIQIGYEDPDTLAKRQWLVDCYRLDPQPVVALLASERVRKLIQYSPFEQLWTRVHLGAKINNVFDTFAWWYVAQSKLAEMDADEVQQLVPGYYRHRNSLADMTRFLLDMELPKDEQLSQWADEQLRDEQLRYAAMDVAVIGELSRRISTVSEALDVHEGEVKGLLHWVMERNFEEHPIRGADERDQHREAQQLLTAASTRDELLDAWLQTRRKTLSYANRRRLGESVNERLAALAQ